MARPIVQTASTGTSTSETSTDETALCAWCLTEEGETTAEGDSHGICQPHADQMLLTHYANKFNATPSYVERFKDGREVW